MPATRHPFGELDGSRLQTLASMKNRQNALPVSFQSDNKTTYLASLKPTLTSPLKRRHSPVIAEDQWEDGENVDPLITQPTKRAKNIDGGPFQKPNLVLMDVAAAALPALKPLGQRLEAVAPQTSAKREENSLAGRGVPAGRSPKRNRTFILPKKRVGSSPFVRVDPPSFLRSRPGGGLPFSIDTALNGTLAGYSQKVTPKPAAHQEHMPATWFFDIYQDTPEEEMANLMEHSACTLDISDDEGKKAAEDDRGKENVPPAGHAPSLVPTVRDTVRLTASAGDAVAAKTPVIPCPDAMTEEDEGGRLPLGNLDTSDFYPPGLDAASVEIIHVAHASDPASRDKVKDLNADLSSPWSCASKLTQTPRCGTTCASQQQKLRESGKAINKPAEPPTFKYLDEPADDSNNMETGFAIWESDHGSDTEAENDSTKRTRADVGQLNSEWVAHLENANPRKFTKLRT